MNLESLISDGQKYEEWGEERTEDVNDRPPITSKDGKHQPNNTTRGGMVLNASPHTPIRGITHKRYFIGSLAKNAVV